MAAKGEKPKGNELLGKVSDFFGKADKGLDKTQERYNEEKEKREKLKKKGKLAELASSYHDAVLAGFKEDLEEIGISGEAQAQYLAEFEAKWAEENMENKDIRAGKTEAISQSQEAVVLNKFIENLENVPLLKDLVAKANPKAKWELKFNEIATKYLGYKPGDPDSEGMMASIKEWVATTFGLGFLMKKGAEAAKPEAPVAPTVTQAAQAPAAAPSVAPTPAPVEIPVVKNEADEKKLAKNIEFYLDALEKATPSPTFEEVMLAKKGKNKLFEKILGEDPEAQEKAVNQYLTKKFSKVGDIAEIKLDEIIFKAKDGGAETKKFKIKKEGTDYFVSKENGVPTKFNGDIDSLIEGIINIEKPATT